MSDIKLELSFIMFMLNCEDIIGKLCPIPTVETYGRDQRSRPEDETEGREHNFPIIHEAEGINII